MRQRYFVTQSNMTASTGSDFAGFGLNATLLRNLAAEGYTTATPIQAQAIRPVLDGHDLVGLAQTGTGKTAAFALPVLHRLAAAQQRPQRGACRALVLAPTRELAAQIAESFQTYGKGLGLTCTVVFGGASMHKQKLALERGVDILVATPGRLLDHVSQRTLRLDQVSVLILDEADHMLDLGFIHPLRQIARLVPAKRQTLFFSATMPPPIRELAAGFLTDPVQVSVTPAATTAERVDQGVIHVEAGTKPSLLASLLTDKALDRTIVFTRTKHGADKVVRSLLAHGHAAEAIHGNKSQAQRERALAGFKSGAAKVLVATEIAARGIDVEGVSHVINYDLPNVPEQYVHRIGRTARAGAQGRAISFCTAEERPYLRDIEKLTRQTVPVLDHPMAIVVPPEAERGPGQRSGQGQRQGHGQGQGQRGRGHGNSHGSSRGQRQPQAAGQASGQASAQTAPQGQSSGSSNGAAQPNRPGSGRQMDWRDRRRMARAVRAERG